MKTFLSALSIGIIVMAIVVAIGIGSLRDYGEAISAGHVALILFLLAIGALTNKVARVQQ